METPRKIRLMVPWIVGFYFLAQIVGITSLFAIHLQHTCQSEVAFADDIATTGHVDHGLEYDGHRHGTSDPGDQCCAMQNHLAAVLPLDLTPDLLGFASASLVLPVPDHLVGAEPRLPDRPPKFLLLV